MPSTQPTDSLWCRRYRETADPAVRLVCFPHAGGTAPFYRPLSFALKSAVDVVSIQYPGRQDRHREPAIDSVRALADRVHEVLAAEPALPVVLLGHSMGAVVAFEVARRFEAAGQVPVRLVASGRRGPATRHTEAVHRGGDAAILAEIRRLNGAAAAVLDNEELMRAALPALRADYRAVETYSCGPDVTVACPITVLTGDADPKTPVAEARAWERHTTGGFDLRVFPGGHFFLTDAMPEVAGLLDRCFAAGFPRHERLFHDVGRHERVVHGTRQPSR
ncbi:thioesterase II family protein [Amycolatopsis tolypomycina]|uniref:thioesterase II family protein n=1 Tax=Amycolatopsis tolypomycina TaxID=208445 RepID=UPI00339FEBC0